MPDQDGEQPSGQEPERPHLYAQGEPGKFRGLPSEIGKVTGRKARGGGRGLPALDQFSLRLEKNGRELEFGPLDDGPEQRAEFVAEIFAHSFGLRQRGTLDAHVPDLPLGRSDD